MSGLAAVFGASEPERAVERMLAAAPARGSVIVAVAAGAGALGVQNRPDEHPFTTGGVWRDGPLTAAVSGCLYDGSSIVSGADAARRVLERYGAGRAMPVAGGSFAAVVHDEDRRLTLLSRSAMGERPLFLRRHGGAIAVASEIKQVRAAPMPPPSIDAGAVLDEAAFSFTRPRRTAYHGVRRVLAGTSLLLGDTTEIEATLWSPAALIARDRASMQDATREFLRLLAQAVRRRMTADTAVLMSGGLDSTAVAHEGARIHAHDHGAPLLVVCARFPRYPSVDESALEQAAAAALGCRIAWVDPTPRPFDDLARDVAMHDAASVMPLQQNYEQLLRAARDAGALAVLDGHDGDTVLGLPLGILDALLRRGAFATAARYARRQGRARHLTPVQTARAIVGPAVLGIAPAARALRRGWRDAATPSFPPWLTAPLLDRFSRSVLPPAWPESLALFSGLIVPALFEHLERTALAEGIPALHPLADPELATFLLRLPPEIHAHTGAVKSLARIGCDRLPDAIRFRDDKPEFGPVFRAGSPDDDILAAVRAAPKVLPGVEWDTIEAWVRAGARSPDVMTLRRVLTADLLLGRETSRS